MLEEPRAHNVGGMFRQNPPLIFGLFVFVVQQGREVQVYLQKKNPGGGITWFGYCCHGNKESLPITYPFSFFFFPVAGQKHLLKSHHGN